MMIVYGSTKAVPNLWRTGCFKGEDRGILMEGEERKIIFILLQQGRNMSDDSFESNKNNLKYFSQRSS